MKKTVVEDLIVYNLYRKYFVSPLKKYKLKFQSVHFLLVLLYLAIASKRTEHFIFWHWTFSCIKLSRTLLVNWFVLYLTLHSQNGCVLNIQVRQHANLLFHGFAKQLKEMANFKSDQKSTVRNRMIYILSCGYNIPFILTSIGPYN